MEATLARLAEHAQNVQNNCGKKAMIINEKRTSVDSRFLNGQKTGIANSTHQLRSRCSTFLIGSLMTCMACLLPLLFAKLLMLVFFLRHSILIAVIRKNIFESDI